LMPSFSTSGVPEYPKLWALRCFIANGSDLATKS
jgi:hypothetical protein